MKGFLLSVMIMAVIAYGIYRSDPANASGGGGIYANATGAAVRILPANYESQVAANEAPVLAYFWAPW